MPNPLGQYSGHNSISEVKREIRQLLDIIEIEKIKNESDKGFVDSMRRSMAIQLWRPSGKQLFRLRDIKDRYL